MAFDPSWEHQYCLSCDRQTDGATYCSESCRLSDFDKSSTSYNTLSNSPGSNLTWSGSKPSTKFYLPPAYDFTHPQPYGSPSHSHTMVRRPDSMYSNGGQLTPSSSHSSLNSLQSSSSTANEGRKLSDKAKKQLRDYASSFEHARDVRRRSC
jgi:hypothetical protein